MTERKTISISQQTTLQKKVSQVLREEILKGKFKPGERLKQDHLAKRLGVSRMPLRESLKQLEFEGLVENIPHRGAIIRELSMEQIDEIYTLRSLLEGMALEKSVENLEESDISELYKLILIMENSEQNPSGYIKASMEYHRILLKGSKWKKLLSIIDQLSSGIPNITPFLLEDQIRQSNIEHRLIFEAVKDGDNKKASEHLSKHITRTKNDFKNYMIDQNKKKGM